MTGEPTVTKDEMITYAEETILPEFLKYLEIPHRSLMELIKITMEEDDVGLGWDALRRNPRDQRDSCPELGSLLQCHGGRTFS